MRRGIRTATIVAVAAASMFRTEPISTELSIDNFPAEINRSIDRDQLAKYGVQVVRIISHAEIDAGIVANENKAAPKLPETPAEKAAAAEQYAFVVVSATDPEPGCAELASTFLVEVDHTKPGKLVATLAFAGEKDAVSDPVVFGGPAMYGSHNDTIIMHGESASFQEIPIADASAGQQLADMDQKMCNSFAAFQDPDTAKTIEGGR